MAKNYDKEMYDALRARGLRKKMARAVSATGVHTNGKQSPEASRAVRSLRMAADFIEHVASDHDTPSTGATRGRGSTSKRARTSKRTAGATKTRQRPGARASARRPAKKQSPRAKAANKRVRAGATKQRRAPRRGATAGGRA